MKKLLTLIWLGLMLVGGTAHAQSTSYTTPAARQAMVNWVEANSPARIDVVKARQYVNLAIRWADVRQLDPILILAVMRHESGFNPNAKSPYGAQGLMQVVPRWHRDKLRGRSLFNPDVAIEVGTQVLRDCFDKFNGHTYKSLACYLGGNPSKYYQRIQTTHVTMRTDVKKGWFVAEEPFMEMPRMTQTAMVTRQTPQATAAIAMAPTERPTLATKLAMTASVRPTPINPPDPIGALLMAHYKFRAS